MESLVVDQLNFFRLGKSLKSRFNLHFPDFEVHPSPDIYSRWTEYEKQLLALLRENSLRLEFIQPDIRIALKNVETKMQESLHGDALRALGAISRQAFVGPKRLLIDPVIDCNLDCIYCSLHSKLQKDSKERYLKRTGLQEKSHLDYTLLKKKIEEAAKLKVEQICVVGGGEPTVYPHFLDLVKLVKSYGMHLNFSTNGLKLEEDFNKVLVDSDVNRITISVSGTCESSYKIIHPSQPAGTYTRLREKILDLNLKKERARIARDGKTAMVVDVLHVVHAYNYKDMLRMVIDAKELHADRVWFQLLHMEDFSKFLRLRPEQFEEARFYLQEAHQLGSKLGIEVADYMDLQVEHSRPDGTWAKGIFDRYGCLVSYMISFLDICGAFSFCCSDKLLAKIEEIHLPDFWFSPFYQDMRDVALDFNRENNRSTYYGKKLLDYSCDNCNNHNFQSEMVELLQYFELLPFLKGRFEQSLSSFETRGRELASGQPLRFS